MSRGSSSNVVDTLLELLAIRSDHAAGTVGDRLLRL